MKRKVQIGPFRFKISYRSKSKWLDLFKSTKQEKQKKQVYKKLEFIEDDPVKFLEYKLYRIFKEQYCRFFPGKNYGIHGTEPSSLVYYINKKNDSLDKDKYLIGEFMFGENKVDFFKRKGIFIKETLKEYTIVQEELILATYDKDWINKQGIYQ